MTSRLLPLLLFALTLAHGAEIFIPDMAANATRPWPGKDFWANPAEDWQLEKGRFENNFSGGNRNIVLLTAELAPKPASFTLRTNVEQISYELFGTGYVGFQVGLKARSGDFREAAIAGSGFAAGVDFSGQAFIGQVKGEGPPLALPLRGLVIELKGEPVGAGTYDLSLLVQDETGKILGSARTKADASWLSGLIAVTASTQPPATTVLNAAKPAGLPIPPQAREGEGRFAFSKLELVGDKFERHPERAFGPILWTTYTFDNDGTLCLLTQAAPFARNEKIEAELLLPGRDPIPASFDPISRTARFRVLKLDPAKDYPYEVQLAGDSYKGTVRAAPTGRPVKLASLSCNGGSGLHGDLVANVQAQSPDFIAFLGDQVRADSGGYGCLHDRRPNDRSVLCFLRKYALHGWAWRELLRNTPSITLPDEEDVFHDKIWGAAGKAADISDGYGAASEDSGGYKMSVEFVNAVHRSQTGNLPDAADPSACRSGISVYFTRHAWGPLDFAILADRQFKSAPKALFPTAGIQGGWATNETWDPKTAAAADLDLLGIRQENFLGRWAKAPAKGARFRIALSQSPFCTAETLPKAEKDDRRLAELHVFPVGQFPPDDEPKADLDSNGWPQSPRLKALKLLGEAHAIHLCGDRQLGMTGQYGLGNGSEGPWWISSPAISSSQPRRWMPAKEGKQHRSGDPQWTGAYADAFGNPVTIHAVANPQDRSRDPESINKRATGYTMTMWEPSGKVRVETWPAWASPAKAAPDNKPYEGWPITIDPASGKRVE